MARFNPSAWFSPTLPSRRRADGRRPGRRRRWLPRVEQLEDRVVPTGVNPYKPDILLPDEDGGFDPGQSIQNEATGQFVGPASGQSEMAIAADPTGQHVVIGFNDFAGFNNNPVSVSGFAYSDDGGAHFTYGHQLPSVSNGNIGTTQLPQVVGDPVLAYVPGGSGGQFIYSSIEVVGRGTGTPGNTFAGTVQTMCVHLSTDFGHTWSGPFEVTPASNPHGLLSGNNARDAADKEWIAVDPDTGRVMMVWSNFTSTAFIPGGREISATFSDDAFTNPSGPTWSPRQILNPGATTADQAANVAFAGNGSGNVYVAWSSQSSASTARTNMVVSTDNGASFGPVTPLTASDYYVMDQVLGNDRVHQFPSVAVDNSAGPNQGNVYIAYADNDNHDGADIAFQRSTDGGHTFSAPMLLNARPGQDRAQWFPSVSVDSTTGRVNVTYYDQGVATSGDLTETSWTYSDDGGLTWSRPSPLTSPGAVGVNTGAFTFNPADDRPFHAGYGNDTSQPNIGDYNASVSLNGNLLATWAGTSHLGNYQDGQPTSSFTNPDFYFKSTSTAFASLHVGTPTFTDSGGDGNIDPGELISLQLPLTNYVTNSVFNPSAYTGVTATLTTTTPGVVITQGTVSYPDIAPGATQANGQVFKLALLPTFVPGTPIELSLSVTTNQGSTQLLTTLFTGTPVGTTVFSENFDGVAPGTLPAGWATIHQGGANVVPWTTSNTKMNTASNGLFHQEANDGPGGTNNTRFERVASPLITIPSSSQYVTLDFDIAYDLEDDNSTNPGYTGQQILAYDGADLRITDFTPGHFARANQIEAFEQSFTTDGFNFYNKHLPRSSNSAYFQDQSVWSGSSNGFVHVHMVLPGMGGTQVQLRWDYTQDSGGLASDERPGALDGVMIDNIVMQNVVPTTAVAVADLTIAKTHTGDFAQGGTGTYTVTVSNSGTGVTSGEVDVADLAPAGLTITSMAGDGWTYNSATQTVSRSDLLAPGDSYPPITVTVAVDPNAPASVTNQATVSGGGETNTANDTAFDPTTVTEAPINAAGAALAPVVVGEASNPPTVEVATFTHSDGTEPTGDFTATVDWGIDGHHTDAGTVTQDAGGTYHVSAARPVFAAANSDDVVTVSLSEDGASTSVSDTQVVNPADTTTSLAVTSATTPNAAFTYGNILTFTATVTANSPSAATVNEGAVQFQVDGANFGSPVNVNASGVAKISTTVAQPLLAGGHTITANYSDAAANFNDSSDSKSVTVTKAPLWVTANSRSKTEGDSFTFAGTEFTVAGPAGSRTIAGAVGPILFDGDKVTSVTLMSAGAAANAEDGSYAITPSNAQGSGLSNYNITYVPGTLTVLEPPINVTATPVSAINEGDASASVEVATFTHAGGVEAPGHFTATVDWGVAGHHADAGTVTQDGSGVYHVAAARPVFAEDATYTLSVSVSENDTAPAIVQNFAGLSAHDDLAAFGGSFFIPPDQGSAVGPNHYVEMINLVYAVYNKDGTVAVPATTLGTFYANAGVPGLGANLSDPRIVYDQGSGRWFAVAITTESNSNSIVVAVSQTSDPTGAWKAAKFVANTTPFNFADFPTIGVDANALYVGSNNFQATSPTPVGSGSFIGVSLTTIPKADLLNSAGPVVGNRSHFENVTSGGTPGTTPFTLAPVSDFGGRDHGVIVAIDRPSPATVLHSYRVTNPGSNASTLSADNPITVPTYWTNQLAHQPDGSRTLDGGGFRIGQNNVYQVGNVLWAAQSILTSSATGAAAYDAIRWYEIDETTNTVLQSGTISDPHHDFIYPAIAANAAGDLVIGFSATGDSTTSDYPGAWYVAGTTTGGVTTFGAPTVLRNGSSNYSIGSPRNRWGDFSAISVDPSNPNTFWIADEVVIPGNPAFTTRTQIWGTQVSAIRFGTTASAGGTLTVNEPAIFGSSATLAAVVTGQASASVEVATFTHASGVEPTGDFTATVDWGIDGHHTDSGTVTQDAGGTYHVSSTRPVFNAGTYTVTVSISEDNGSTTVTDTQVVNKDNTTTTLTSSPAVWPKNKPITFTATVTANAPGSGIPTGTVQFFRDGKPQPFATVSLDATGHASTTISLDPGQHTITAKYTGDSNYNPSSGSLTQTASSSVPLAPAAGAGAAAGTASATSSFTASVAQVLVGAGATSPAAASSPAPAVAALLVGPSPALPGAVPAGVPAAVQDPLASPAAPAATSSSGTRDTLLDSLFSSLGDGA
jgi:uncharacterized repeat protein (TIGR01451 family)